MTLKTDITAGLALLPPRMTSDAARLQLYTTSLQENPKRLPKQVGGPAVGDYQMEKGGGVVGVLIHDTSKNLARSVCDVRDVDPTPEAVYLALQFDQVLAAAFARLLYWTDPKPLPNVGDEEGAWKLYLRTWRPGAYNRQPEELRAKWTKNYAAALMALQL